MDFHIRTHLLEYFQKNPWECARFGNTWLYKPIAIIKIENLEDKREYFQKLDEEVGQQVANYIHTGFLNLENISFDSLLQILKFSFAIEDLERLKYNIGIEIIRRIIENSDLESKLSVLAKEHVEWLKSDVRS